MTKQKISQEELEAWLIEDAMDLHDRFIRSGMTEEYGVVDSQVTIQLEINRAEYLEAFEVET